MMRKTERTMHIKESLINVMLMKIKYTVSLGGAESLMQPMNRFINNNEMFERKSSGKRWQSPGILYSVSQNIDFKCL